jgi:hypothetical protein
MLDHVLGFLELERLRMLSRLETSMSLTYPFIPEQYIEASGVRAIGLSNVHLKKE